MEVSNKKFVPSQKRHFDWAENEDVPIRNGKSVRVSGIATQQEEYMTGKEFWEEADKRIIKVCKTCLSIK